MKCMLALILILLAGLCVYAAEDAKSTEEPKSKADMIEEAKEKLQIRKTNSKNEALMLIRTIGPAEFTEEYKTEKEQLKFTGLISVGSSRTEATMVRAELLLILMDSEYEAVQIKAADSFPRFAMYIDQPEAFKKLHGLMKSKNPELRLATTKAIEGIAHSNTIEQCTDLTTLDMIDQMIEYYDDEDTRVAARVIKMFPKTNNKEAARKLKELTKSKDPTKSKLAINYFTRKKIVDDDIRKVCLKILDDKNKTFPPKRSAVRYLGSIGEEKAVPLLIKVYSECVKSDIPPEEREIKQTKKAILENLGLIGGEEALKHCIKYVQEPEIMEVHEQAGIAIEKITGKDLGYEEMMVPSQKEITDIKFKVWYIRDYLKEGDKRKEEIGKLEKEISKFEIEMPPKIIIERVLLKRAKLDVKSFSEEIRKIGTARIVEEINKLPNKKKILESLGYLSGDIESRKKIMTVVAAYLEDDDLEIQGIALMLVAVRPEAFDYDTVYPILEKLSKDEKGRNYSPALRAKSKMEMVKAYFDSQEKKKEEKKGPKE